MTTDLESRIRQLEDRVQISEQVIKYAMGVDRRDWAMFASCFTDPVFADFSGGGMPAATVSRADLVARVSTALSGFTATQHISPNHVIEFDASDPWRAVCYSYMYAQHLLGGSDNGEFYLLRGSYTNHMLRTADGWRIERIIQHRSWEYGNTRAVAEATARSQADRSGRDPAAALGVRFMSDDPYSASGPSVSAACRTRIPQLKPEQNCQLRAPTNSEKPRSRPEQNGSGRFPIGGLSPLGDRLADDRSPQHERARPWLARRAGI